MSVTKENIHDGKMLKELVDNVSKKYDIKKVLADGGYMILKITLSILMSLR